MAGLWKGPVWKQAGTLQVSHFHPDSGSHRPKTLVKLLYTRKGIGGIFHVEDNYVRCVHNNYLDPVYKDSCVGFVFRPGPTAEYFSFEFNCGGTIRASFITIADDTEGGLNVFMPLSRKDGAAIRVYHSLPAVVEPEMVVPTVWILEFFIPYTVIAKFVCKPRNIKGHEWRVNLYKCGDATSRPHWASWVSLPSRNFQPPENFGKIRFE